eukprot:1642252-Pyramimonas_sp.AAC.1
MGPGVGSRSKSEPIFVYALRGLPLAATDPISIHLARKVRGQSKRFSQEVPGLTVARRNVG